MGLFDKLLGPPNIEKLKRKADVNRLINVLTNQKDSDIRRQSATALGELGNAQALSALADTLIKDNNLQVRKACAEALGALGDLRATEPLAFALKSEVFRVKKTAPRGLLKEILIKGEHKQIHDAIVNVLHKFGSNSVMSLVAAISTDEMKDWREVWDENLVIKEALKSLGAGAIEPLIATLKDEHPLHRTIAAEVLGDLGNSKAVEPLIDALKDEDNDVRRSAAGALGKLNDPHSVDALIVMLKDEHWHVRLQAATALKKIGDVRAIYPLIESRRAERELTTWEAVDKALLALMAGKPYEVVAAMGPTVVDILIDVLKHEITPPGPVPPPGFPWTLGVLKQVAVLLGEIGDARAVDALANVFERAPNYIPEITTSEDVMEEAAAALAKIGTPAICRMIELLGQFSRDTDIDRFKRAAIIKALERIGAIDALVEAFVRAPSYTPERALPSDIPYVIAATLSRLGKSSVNALLTLLERYTRDTDSDRHKREVIIEAMEHIDGPEAERALAEYRARQK